MKRILILAAALLCLSACQALSSEAPPAESAAPVVVMSSPEKTAERGQPDEQGSSPTSPASQAIPTEPASDTTAPTEQSTEAEAAEGMYLLVNGVRLAPGMPYAEVKPALGAQTAPDQALDACDGSSFGTIHFYSGMTVTENESGVIRGIECSVQFEGESDTALLGRVGLGATRPEVLAALGVPENAASADLDCVLSYRQEGLEISVCFFDAENPDTVSSIQMTVLPE